MVAILLCGLACTIQIVMGLLLPGLFLTVMLRRFLLDDRAFRESEPSASRQWLEWISMGAIYLALQTLLLESLYRAGLSTIGWIVVVKVLMDLVCAALLLTNGRNELWQLIEFCRPWKWEPSTSLQVTVATLFGLASILFVPYGLDNSAVGWVTRKLDYFPSVLRGSQGAISYLGILFVPSIILKGLAPVPTLAACLKLPLSWLLALLTRRLAEVASEFIPITKSSIGWYGLIVQLVVLCTSIGKYGIFDTGKETVFAMLFLFVLATELIAARPQNEEWYWRVGIFLAASIGFGAMAVPYGFMLLSSYLIFSAGRINPFRFTYCSLFCAFPALLVSVHAMLHWTWMGSAVAIIAPMFIAAVLIPAGDRMAMKEAYVSRRGYQAILVVLIASLLAVSQLMPIEFHRGKFPLDGEAGLIQLIMHQNKFDFVGLIGMACFFLVSGVKQRNCGVLALLCFPFFVAIPALLMAKFSNEISFPVHPQNIWDWLKDIPRWISGIYLATFSIAFWHVVAQWLDRRQNHRKPLGAVTVNQVAFIFVLLLVFLNVRQINKRVSEVGWPIYTSIGGHTNDDLAQFVEWAYLAKSETRFLNYDSRPLIVDDASEVNDWLPALSMYGIRIVSVSEFFDRSIDKEETYWCVCSEEKLPSIMQRLKFEERFDSKVIRDINDERVFRLSLVSQIASGDSSIR